MKEDVELYFTESSEKDLNEDPFSSFETFDKDHGQIEKRKYWVCNDINWLTMKDDWKGLQSICMVKTE